MDGFLFDVGRSEEKPKGLGDYDRDYQCLAVEKTYDRLVNKDDAACQILMATGLGKTNVATRLIRRDGWPKDGIVFCTPRQNLVRQTADRLRSLGVPCGIEMAESRSDEAVTVACYASLIQRRRQERLTKTTGLLVIDECHLNYTKASQAMVNSFKGWGSKVIGMTATPRISKKTSLYDTYGDPSFVMGYFDGVDQGWLVPAKQYLTVLEDLDLSAWRESWVGKGSEQTMDGKPVSSSAVGKFLARKENVTAICGMVEKYWEGLPSVVFCMTIAQAEEVQRELLNRKIAASIIHSKMDTKERFLHQEDFESGRSNVIVNVGCLTLGWDSPRVQKLFIARPTKQQPLYIQMLGRGTRTVPGLVDRYHTAEQRKNAIAKSSKPHMEIFDITDASRCVDIKTSMDILRPDLDPRLMKRIRTRALRQSDTIEVDAVLAEESRAVAAEDAERARYEYERRQDISGSSTCTAYERDVRSDAEHKDAKGIKDYWWMPYGRHRGKGFSKIPIRDLEYYAKNAPENIARNIRKYLRGKQNS